MSKLLRRAGLPLTLLAFAAAVALVLWGLSAAARTRSAEAKRAVEDALRRAAMSCYAIEGRYPPSLEYITDNYGVYIDGDEFFVHYSVYASNIMPEITVLDRRGTQ